MNRTHGDAGAGVSTTNNSLEANNLHFKSVLGGGRKKRLPVMEAVVSLIAAVKTMSMRDTVPAAAAAALPFEAMTAHADKKYVTLRSVGDVPTTVFAQQLTS